jgi:putative DNA primase/helicase
MITYLKVPFNQKGKAKALGARWDGERKQWYVKNVEDLSPFTHWMDPRLLRPTRHQQNETSTS